MRSLLDEVFAERPFRAVPGLPQSAVPGHEGAFIHGRCAGTPVVLQCGRLHAYQGLAFEDVTRPVDVMHEYGVDRILFTNAAGGLWPKMRPGDLVTAAGVRPWRYGPFDLPATLDVDFRVAGCDFTGDYVWMHGPCYETRAEVAALQSLGAAVVGMSAAPELLRCRQLGIRAGLVSCVTNSCCTPQILTHDHVVATAQRASARLCEVIRAALPRLTEENNGPVQLIH